MPDRAIEHKREKIMYMIAGLGNPTKKYEKTRHNMGFDCIDELSRRFSARLKPSRFNARVGKASVPGVGQVLLVKPYTYMNASGNAIAPLVKYYKLKPETELIVIYDDTDLDVGKIRVRAKGSAGSHNGMKSVTGALGSENFARVRIGIGRRPEKMDMIGFVLGRFDSTERKLIDKAIEDAADAVLDIITNGCEHAMNSFN